MADAELEQHIAGYSDARLARDIAIVRDLYPAHVGRAYLELLLAELARRSTPWPSVVHCGT